MKHLIGWLGRATSYILYRAPRGVRTALGYMLAFLWFDLFRIRRKVAVANVGIAFPELSERERVRIARASLRHMGTNFVEYSLLPWVNKDNIERFAEFRNTAVFDAALAKGRGVLLLTLHLGNGDFGCSALSIRGYPMVMVSKFFKAKWLNDLWFGMRERVGTKFVPPRNSSYALLKALKSKQAVVIPLDQFTGPPIGVRTSFFGRETGTAAGLAVMAERSQAPVVSVYAWRQPGGRHAIEFVREVPIEGLTTEQATQRFNDELEGFVRKHPEQWMWIHKRWKTFKF
jgi:KDO2-lipid IV(A) lauroyltransferase